MSTAGAKVEGFSNMNKTWKGKYLAVRNHNIKEHNRLLQLLEYENNYIQLM